MIEKVTYNGVSCTQMKSILLNVSSAWKQIKILTSIFANIWDPNITFKFIFSSLPQSDTYWQMKMFNFDKSTLLNVLVDSSS